MIKPPETAVSERPHPLTPVVQAWVMLVALGIFLFREWIEGDFADISSLGNAFQVWGTGLWTVLIITVIQIVFGIFRWIATRFIADESEFRIERTFIWHSSDRINYSKIQSVDIHQPFAARLLGLAKLYVDVGGGPGKKIEYLSRQRAEELRDALLRRSSAELSPAIQPEETDPGTSAEPPLSAPEKLVVTARPLHLVIIAVTSTAFLTLFLFLIAHAIWAMSGGVWEPALALILPLGGIITTKVVGQWNYRLIQSGGSLRVIRGLTSVVSQTVPRHRIQGIRISQPLLARPFGLWRVQVTVLGYGISTDADEINDLMMPAGTWQDVSAALHAIWPGFNLADLPWQGQPPAARWLTWFTYRHRGWSLSRLIFASRRGLWNRRIDLVPYARIQGIDLSQGPLQRLLGLACVNVRISPGSVSATAGHLLGAEARRLAEQLTEAGRSARAGDLALHALLAITP